MNKLFYKVSRVSITKPEVANDGVKGAKKK